MKRRIVAGESLEVWTGGGSYEVGAAPYANPPAVFCEGRRFPYTPLDAVIDVILEALEGGEVRCCWVESRGIQTKACQEAHGRHTASRSTRPQTTLAPE
jgi:hypothetical protein